MKTILNCLAGVANAVRIFRDVPLKRSAIFFALLGLACLGTANSSFAAIRLVKDIQLGPPSSNPRNFMPLGNGIAFIADFNGVPGVWFSDGDPNNTFQISSTISLPATAPKFSVQLGNFTYFVALDSTSGAQIWRTDGTVAGTSRVTNINPGATGGNPHELVVFKGSLYFVASDVTHGQQVWVTDGTLGHETQVTTVGLFNLLGAGGQLLGDADPLELTNLNDQYLFFSANTILDVATSKITNELFRTDGTLAGTVLVKSLTNGLLGSNPLNLTKFGNSILLAADGLSQSSQLWISDGTSAGTKEIADINSLPIAASNPGPFVVTGSKAIFAATSAATGRELYVTDGTSAGTLLLNDINPGSASSNPSNLTVLPCGCVVFSATEPTDGTELWVTDGTSDGTMLLKDLNPGIASSDPSNFMVAGPFAYFTATMADGSTQLFETDASNAGPLPVAGTASISSPQNGTIAAANGVVFLAATTPATGTELFAQVPPTPSDFRTPPTAASDILFQNANGLSTVWFMNGIARTGSATIAENPIPEWKIVGTGDFNHDGRTDIVFQKNTGEVGVWLMNGTTFLSAQIISNVQQPTGWRVVGVDDFKGNGKPDLLWQNGKNIAVWLMDGIKIKDIKFIANDVPPGWRVVGTGDFNNDGWTDIAWQHTSGAVGIWFLNGTTRTSVLSVWSGPLPGWKAVGTGDFNHDGNRDLLFQNSSSLAVWYLANGALTTYSLISTLAPDGYSVRASH